jgi:hypothetical protein
MKMAVRYSGKDYDILDIYPVLNCYTKHCLNFLHSVLYNVAIKYVKTAALYLGFS